jgi:predicted  nucleic acid-binding Zn-ribbon protein
MEMQPIKPKGFWERPEGTTGMVFLAAIIFGGGFLLYKALPFLIKLAENTLYFSFLMAALAGIVYVILDPKMRNLVSYMYKSVMRWITGVFVQIDPIGILKNYVDDLKNNLSKMNQQLARLKGQMVELNRMIQKNKSDIQNNLSLANKAKEVSNQAVMVLKARKAGRLQDSNMKFDDLYKKMEILYRVLSKMYSNSEIMLEDIQDQIVVKEAERKAIRMSHSAMKSAMSILTGDPDKRAMFDQAMDAITNDVSVKVGEMERFMEMSGNLMNSIDLQNGVFEEEGIAMLDKWEKEGISLILGDDKQKILNAANNDSQILDLNTPIKIERPSGNQYDKLFE